MNASSPLQPQSERLQNPPHHQIEWLTSCWWSQRLPAPLLLLQALTHPHQTLPQLLLPAQRALVSQSGTGLRTQGAGGSKSSVAGIPSSSCASSDTSSPEAPLQLLPPAQSAPAFQSGTGLHTQGAGGSKCCAACKHPFAFCRLQSIFTRHCRKYCLQDRQHEHYSRTQGGVDGSKHCSSLLLQQALTRLTLTLQQGVMGASCTDTTHIAPQTHTFRASAQLLRGLRKDSNDAMHSWRCDADAMQTPKQA